MHLPYKERQHKLSIDTSLLSSVHRDLNRRVLGRTAELLTDLLGRAVTASLQRRAPTGPTAGVRLRLIWYGTASKNRSKI